MDKNIFLRRDQPKELPNDFSSQKLKDPFNFNIIDFRGLKITLASPEQIRQWSHGEVIKPETINYRTLKPEKDGLFSENIFGPTKDWECYCGKYKRIRYRGIICDKCGVEVTQSKVRRERMGHITLASPIAHVWYFKGTPSRLSLLLDISQRSLEGVIYYAQYLVTDIDEKKKKDALENIDKIHADKKKEIEEITKEEIEAREKEFNDKKKEAKGKIKSSEQLELTVSEIELELKQKVALMRDNLERELSKLEEITEKTKSVVKTVKLFTFLTEDEFLRLHELKADTFFKVGMGAEALLSILKNINLDELAAKIREESEKSTGQKHIKATKRLRIIEGLRKSQQRPEWMILKILPVIPPDLRPMVQLTGGRFATSDLNDLYRRVINRNARLKHLMDLGAPEIILRNEKRMLQEAVDALIDTSQRASSRPVPANQQLRSLSDMLRGKQGRFRQNLLGKRVDYSGRSVIIVGPELHLDQCGIPKEMALEMFKPFVLRELILRGFAPNVKSAKHILERKTSEIWDILEDITKNHPVLLNRAPTLHKLGIQAFFPILIEGDAIRIHPCVCAGYNADFDGDQMAIHVPLSKESQDEAIALMTPKHNLLKPADGSPITIPNKEMALGCFFYTSIEEEGNKDENNQKIFFSESEAILAYQTQKIKLRKEISVRIDGKIIKTSVGRILLNEILPEKLRFINEPVKGSTIKKLITRALSVCSNEEVVSLIDNLKSLGFDGAARAGGVSVSVFDCEMVEDKNKLINEAEDKITELEKSQAQGLITKDEERRLSFDIWIETTDRIADLTWENLKKENSVKIIIDSEGARASKDQLKQLSAMRGLVVDPLGKIVPLPTKSNFREGLSIFEYVTTTRGSRKGLTDSALKTADAGYLTRRLVDVAHDMIIRSDDCKTTDGIEISTDDKRKIGFIHRLLGRTTAKKIINPKTKKVIVKENEEITENALEEISESGIKRIFVRSPLTCQAKYGMCAACYGRDFSTRKKVEKGTPVGVVAAQSIGEPGTQLTMRVRHAGGIIGLDVTQGLPRVEELFEARTPKNLSPISEISGKIEIIEDSDGFKKIRVKSVGVKPKEEREYIVPASSEIKVKDEDLISAGDQLCSGYLDIKEVLEVRGLRGTQNYLIDEIQQVYESQGIPINDKHFEVIVRKMSDKVKIEDPGDTNLLSGEHVDKTKFEGENIKVIAQGGEPSTALVTMLGITRASLFTESWLSSSSFQETTSVLADAAIIGKEDYLLGLKENVIIGRLIPTSEERAKIEE